MAINEDIKDCGLSADLLKAVLRRKGAAGLREVIGRARTLAGRYLHPDTLQGANDATYLKLSNAVTALLEETDEDLADLIKRYKATRKPKTEPLSAYQKPAYQPGSILRDSVANHAKLHCCAASAPITIRPLALEVKGDITKQIKLDAGIISSRYQSGRTAAEAEAKAIQRKIDSARGEITKALCRYDSFFSSLEHLKSIVFEAKKAIKEAKKQGDESPIDGHIAAIRSARAKMPAAENALRNVAQDKELAIDEINARIARLEQEYGAAKVRENAKIAELDARRTRDKDAANAEAEARKLAIAASRVSFLLELTADGIRYRRDDDQADWQTEPGVFLVGSFSSGVSSFMRDYARIPTTDNIGTSLIGATGKNTGLADPLPRIPIADVFFAGVEEFYSPLLYKDIFTQRLLAAVDSNGTLFLLGYLPRQ